MVDAIRKPTKPKKAQFAGKWQSKHLSWDRELSGKYVGMLRRNFFRVGDRTLVKAGQHPYAPHGDKVSGQRAKKVRLLPAICAEMLTFRLVRSTDASA